MSHKAPIPQDSDGQAGAQRAKPGLLADPVVRTMVYASMGLVILFLATVVGVLVTGVTVPTGPRSVVERQVLTAAAQVQGTTGEANAPYIDALIAAGNLQGAKVALGQARTGVSDKLPTPDLDLAEARLLSATEKYSEAVAMADKAMAGYKAEREALAAKETDPLAANRIGLNEDYYNAALVKAYALVKLGSWKDAVAAFDIYVKTNPTASDILIDRANAKAAMNDKTGAEQDFRAALKFVPYDEEAKAGLKKMGASQ